MSINVTVSGNPISIKKGKMVTIDSSSSKDEFEKRRLMRLEQVRQQSKEIAGDVRNKVRREKLKQMMKIEEDGKEKLKHWQNRKLLELQSQYQEAVKALGSGHKSAQNVGKDDETFERLQMQNKQFSIQRGKDAATKLQIDKNQENLMKSIPLQYKKIARDVENTRSKLISKMKTSKNLSKKRKKKAHTNINITIPGSQEESDDSTSTDVTSTENASINGLEYNQQENSEASDNPREPLKEFNNIGKEEFLCHIFSQ